VTSARRSRLEPLLVWALIAVIGWSYFRDARGHGPLTSTTPPSYYGLLTEALAAGQVHLKLIPDPKLLRLADPYAGPQGASRPHDMSFYQGKFYLYYGITPALVLMVPWLLLTGTYLTEVATTATLCFAGFLFAVGWLLRIRRRFFPLVGRGWLLLGIAVLGLGSPIYFLGNNPTFYAVPIAGGFFCLMFAGLLFDRAIATSRLNTSAVWLAFASITLGFAVGARPNYFLCLPLLLLPVWYFWKASPRTPADRPTALALLLAAVLPAAVVGLGLALYNYLRFGHLTEFGIQYSMASASVREIKLIGFEYYPKNLRLYLLHAADFIRYFPFFYAGDRPFGVLPHFTLTGAALLLPLTWFYAPLHKNRRWLLGGLFWLGAAVANLAILALFFGGEDRYLVDFAPSALVLSCALVFAAVQATQRWAGLPRRCTHAVLAGVALWTILNGTFFAFSRRVPSPLLTAIEQTSNRLVATLENFGGATHGPLEIKLRFPTQRTGLREPIVTTGNFVGHGDIVSVTYVDATHVQFGFFHLGAGGPVGAPIAIDYAAEHTLTLHLGSLYPPRQHPLFEPWTEPQVNRARRRLEVILDGQTALQASVNVYPATPEGVRVGANPIAPDVTQPKFTGQILASRRLGAQPPPLPAVWPQGPVRLTLRLPPTAGGAPVPLVSTGISGAGDLLSLQLTDTGRVRFIHDCWGSPDYTTDAIAVPNQTEHIVEIEMGSLYPADDKSVAPLLRRRLAIWCDGQLVTDVERPFNPATPDSVEFGFNAIQASSAVGMFIGTVVKTERIPSRTTATSAEVWGPIALTARFPKDAIGLKEPLLTTGTLGAADIVYVHYLDATHVQFGLDHWSEGLSVGPVVEIDPSRPQELTFVLGSLFPPAAHPAWAGRPADARSALTDRIEVRLGDRVVLSAPRPAYPSRPNQVVVGRNDLGASSCQRLFSGEILRQQRLPW
jgi:hypothetical protein